MPKTKTISILFSTYTDVASKVVYLLSNRGYTHVSIALDSNFEYFYAFNTKGFRKEYPKKHKNFHFQLPYKKVFLLLLFLKRLKPSQ